MQKRRTQHFKITLCSVIAFSCAFLSLLLLFGRQPAVLSLSGMTGCVFSVMAMAAASFLLFSFAPYFRDDRRWYGISALLTLVFFASAVLLWQIPVTGGAIG